MDGNTTRVLRDAMYVMAEAQAKAHHRVIEARRGLLAAQGEYEEALMGAGELGLSYADLARACGTSEAAIRLYIKRRKDRKS